MINGHRVIAVEEHFATTAYLETSATLPVWPGDETEMALMRAVQSAPVMRDRLADLGTRFAEMDASGTDLAVLSLNPPGVQPYDPGTAVSLAREFNDVLTP